MCEPEQSVSENERGESVNTKKAHMVYMYFFLALYNGARRETRTLTPRGTGF